MSQCIILHFVPLNSYWLHETCLKFKLYVWGGQREGRKKLEERRGRWEDNIEIGVKSVMESTAYSLCVVCCTGLCSNSAALQHLQSAVQPTARWYKLKLYVISTYSCKCRPPHYNIVWVFCEVEYTHAQTDDAPWQLNRSVAQGTVLKWRQVFWVCLWESRNTTLKEFWKVTGCLFVETCSVFIINFVNCAKNSYTFAILQIEFLNNIFHYYQYIRFTHAVHTNTHLYAHNYIILLHMLYT
jgi:hypothetical protein